MTRDYAKKKRPAAKKAAPKSQVPWWVWLFIGSVGGAFVMFLIYLAGVAPTNQSKTSSQQASHAPTTAKPQPEPEPEKKQELPKPRFDFYTLLEESEEIVPATEPKETTEQKTREPAMEYLLQVGSFRRAQDAESLRAQLILLNLDARTEEVTIRGNERWHRVVIGPFDNQSRLAKTRSTLVSNRYNALVLKRSPEG
ncbi:SPOR domain-containing protein [Gilvimarinus xylanilyticus]|uniref:SPOR domain-containing protein n=1 Tax=Gilvimarinus xylanilyticus TaxID=2944139 RepID=A0A9X2I151_9GAMM|nr:SPOR domain-containing protein [Gilvimarinus xylanilyticus]MCP8900729.1 SPOR domain-containing protein [Gilvimarinus xylanilyticus]